VTEASEEQAHNHPHTGDCGEQGAPENVAPTTHDRLASKLGTSTTEAEEAPPGETTVELPTEPPTADSPSTGLPDTRPREVVAGTNSTSRTEMPPDYWMFDDDYPETDDEGVGDIWYTNTKCKAVNDFINNPELLFAKVSRFCLDCRAVNDINVKEHFWPDKIHGLEEMRIACKLDLRQAFHNMLLDEKSRDITTFQTPFGKYRYKRVAMGFVNASHMLCEFLTVLVGNMKSVIIYYDGILIMAKDNE
jgi:hypothetical protein